MQDNNNKKILRSNICVFVLSPELSCREREMRALIYEWSHLNCKFELFFCLREGWTENMLVSKCDVSLLLMRIATEKGRSGQGQIS